MDYINRIRSERHYTEIRICKKESVINIIGIIVLAGLLIVSAAFGDMQKKKERAEAYQPQIAGEVLRFHVLANSDSEEDQQLKLKVKEEVLAAVRPMLEEAESKAEAEEILQKNMQAIEAVADNVIFTEGYDYKSKGVIGKTTFPVKKYGDMVFPAGEYEAFRILLGEAKGKNWWCVMFPTLCYVDEVYDVITEENKEQFQEILTEEEYNSLLATMESACREEMDKDEEVPASKGQGEKKGKVFYKMKSLIWLNKMIDYFAK